MVTINDVAKVAGVSTTTVSYVLTGKRYVSDELKSRVYSAMKEVGYKPNYLARSLRVGRTQTIGLVVPDSSNLFFAEISKYIEDIGFTNGYTVFLCNSDDMLEKQRDYLDVIISKQVDGIVLISVENDRLTHEKLTDSNIPYVYVDRDDEEMRSDMVLVDNFGGGYSATQHLINLGHRNIGCITGPSTITPSADRSKGYFSALEENEISVNTDYIMKSTFRFKGGYTSMSRLLNLKDRPTAVFIQNDMMVLGAYRAISESSLRVPEDISIVGFDNSPLAEIMTPSLTTIAQPIEKIARKAMEILIDRIQGKKTGSPNRYILKTKLIVRDSTQVHTENEI